MSGGKRWSRAEDLARSLARAFLVALPLLLPFEAPLCTLGPLTITSAELALYLTVGAWGLGVMAAAARAAAGPGGWRDGRARLADAVGLGRSDGLGRAVALWLGVMAVSALLAPAFRGPALKFTLRAASGVALFFAARDLARAPADARRLAGSAVAGACLAAGTAILESALGGVTPLWRMFRPAEFSTFGLPRASGAFAYPTIGSMYWEAALPLAMAAPFTLRGRFCLPGLRAALALAGSALLAAALLLSATRTALVGAVVAAAAMLLLGFRAGRGFRVAAAGTLALLTLVVAASVFGSPWSGTRFGQRLRFWNDGSWFRARYTLDRDHLTLAAGAEARVEVAVRNVGTLAWPHAGREAVRLSYHWETRGRGGPRLYFEGRRTSLPADVQPGEEVRLPAAVDAPETPGAYRLRWDLVREQVTWFSERGNATADQTVDVVAATAAGVRHGPRRTGMAGRLEDTLVPPGPSRSELWRAAMVLARRHPVLGVGPDNFRRLYPDVIRPEPGRRYTDDRLHANNVYFETLADLGLLGLAALALTIVALARRFKERLRAVASAGAPWGDRLVTAAWGVAVGMFFLHGLLDYFLEFTPTYGLYWLSMALAAGAWPPAAASPAPPDSTA
jgi:hypothetical protein